MGPTGGGPRVTDAAGVRARIRTSRGSSKWTEKLKQIDPLTGESILTDRQFEINAVDLQRRHAEERHPKEYTGGDKKEAEKGNDNESPEAR